MVKFQTRGVNMIDIVRAKQAFKNYVKDYDINNPIKKIDIRNDGRLIDSFGKGFFDEADRQVEDLVNRKVERHGRFSKK